jgi:hypothetical protein
MFIVTIKLNKKPNLIKEEGKCPCEDNLLCTDIIGAHHSILIEASCIDQARKIVSKNYSHITRIEKVGLPK